MLIIRLCENGGKASLSGLLALNPVSSLSQRAPAFRARGVMGWRFSLPHSQGPSDPSCSLQLRLSRFILRERSTYRRQGTRQVLNAFLLIDGSTYTGLLQIGGNTVTRLIIPVPRPLSFDKNYGLRIRKFHVPNRTVHSGCTDPTQATARLVICKQDTNRALMKRHISVRLIEMIGLVKVDHLQR